MLRYNESEQKTTVVQGSSMSVGTLLTIVFVVLKLCHVIEWSWFWVLSPLIFSFGLLVLFIIGAIIAAIIINNLD